ncbi:MAG: biosynthetic-type acetolactate synthase large subunit [Chloroflexi bacterium]|nr:biosynthetic-type acetolactate synthase large subunit [Chloroflexota bacterium]
MRRKGAQILLESLIQEGVEVVYGLPGGTIIPVYDTLPQYPQLRHILVRHEQGASLAADGYARATGKVGVCMATSGPGATNLITGIACAYMDSSPIVAITGQVATPFIGKDSFQEVDITGITLPITKHNYLVEKVEDLAEVVREAFYIASTGRPGPVLIDLPRDVQTSETTFHYPQKVNLPGYKPTIQGHPTQIKKAAKLIYEAKKPVIIAGHGVIISRGYQELRELAEKAQVPVITTLHGISCFPESHVLSLGFMGMHGMAYANMAVNDADLIIAIGMRFDDRVTGNLSTFAPHAQVIHIDIDPAEIGKNIRVAVPIVGDAKSILGVLNQDIAPQTRGEWLAQIDQWRRDHPLGSMERGDKLLPQYVVRKICEVTKGDAIVVTGVGQNQMFAAQWFTYDKPNSYISSGGLGTMGFGLPAAMGVSVGCPEETVWCIDGDGSFQMNIQELATLVQESIPVKVAILNNGFLGMVRQWQDLFYQKRYVGTPLSGPDFAKVAEAYGVLGLRVTTMAEVEPAIQRAMDHDGAVVVDFAVEPEENVYPMVAPGASISDMIHHPERVKV